MIMHYQIYNLGATRQPLLCATRTTFISRDQISCLHSWWAGLRLARCQVLSFTRCFGPSSGAVDTTVCRRSLSSQGHVSRQAMTRPSKRIDRKQIDAKVILVILQVLLRSEKTGKQDAWLEECHASFCQRDSDAKVLEQ